MAKNYIQPGDVLTLTAPTGGVSSGDGVIVGNLFAVATGAAAEGAEFEGQMTGVWELPKAAGEILEGAAVWWDSGNGNIVNASSAGLFPIGAAVRHAETGDATVRVRLSGVPVTAVPGT
jgi:predicted RecA/RadA family phage recombinase